MKEAESQLIHSFSRNQHEKINLSLRKYKGKHYVDFRLWFQTKTDPTYRPTTKGITFPLELLTEFNQGMNRLLKVRDKLSFNDETGSG